MTSVLEKTGGSNGTGHPDDVVIGGAGSRWGAVLGGIYLVGRFVYLRSYVADPAKRGAGFGLSMLPIFALLIGALIGVVSALLRG